MTRTEALLPCPFCGSADLEQAYLDTIRKWGFIRCRNCGAQAGDVRTSYEPEPEWFDAAAAEWNKRALPDTVERGEWLPISEAPKDGVPGSSSRWLLLFGDGPGFASCHYIGYWGLGDDGHGHECWRSAFWPSNPTRPTHWQPLSSPPARTGEDDGSERP